MSDISEIAKREYEGGLDNISVNCSDINEDDSSRYTNLNENNSKPDNETEYCNIYLNSVEDMKCSNEGNTADASTSEKGDVQHDKRELPNNESKEYKSSEHFKPQSNVEHFALASESPATSNPEQRSIEYTPDIMEVFSTISSQNQRTAMHSFSTKSYPNDQELTDIISTSTTEDNILDDLHKIDENHLIDIPDVMKTYKDEQIPNLMDIKSKCDTSVVNDNHEQSNKTNNGTSNLLFGHKEFSGEKKIENCKIQDMSEMFCEGNVADTMYAKHTKSHSSFSCYQQLSGDRDGKGSTSNKLVDFSVNLQEDIHMVVDNKIKLNALNANQTLEVETQEELRRNCSHHIDKSQLDSGETIKNETNSAGQTDVSSMTDNNESGDESKSQLCKLNSVNVPDPSIPMTMFCSFSDELAVNDLKTDKSNLDGEEGGTSIKMQQYGIVCESNQQTFEEKDLSDTQKLHVMTHHSLEYDSDYTGEKAAKASTSEKGDVQHDSRKLPNKESKENKSSEHVNPQSNVEHSAIASESPATSNPEQGSIEYTPDIMEVFSAISSQNQRTVMHSISTESYPNDQELTDIISTSTTEDNILDDLHKKDENHLIDIPDDMKTYKDQQIPNLMDIKSKSDTNVVNNDHEQSNKTNNGTSNLLFGHKEFSGEKKIENCKIQDMSKMFCEGNVADTMYAKHTESHSSFSCHQQLLRDRDGKGTTSNKLVDFSDDLQEDINMMVDNKIKLNVLNANQALEVETQEEFRRNCSHHIDKSQLDPAETIKNETNSEGQTDASSMIEINESGDESKSQLCKLNSVNVPNPSIPMTMFCSFSDELAVNDLKTDKRNLDGEEGGPSIKMQQYGIVCESNQQTFEGKDMSEIQKLQEMTHHSLECDGDYTGEKVSENESPVKTHISMSDGSEKVDVLCHDYTEYIKEGAKVDSNIEVKMSLNNMQTTAPTAEHIHVKSTAATVDANKDDVTKETPVVKNEKDTKGKWKKKLFPNRLGGKKGKNEVSALFSDHATSEVVLSKYTNTQTELSMSLQGTQSKRRSMLSSLKRLYDSSEENEQSMIDFGTRCKDCLSRPFENMNGEEIRCLNCFKFACLLCEMQCTCGNTCYCKMIAQTIEEKMERTKKMLRESINGRLPNEDTIYIVSTHCYNLHNGKTTLNLEMRLSKHFEAQDENKTMQSQENFIKVLVLDYEDPSSREYLRSRQAVCVTLKTVVDEKVIGLYSKDTTARQERFISPLIKYLGSRDIQVQKVDEFFGKLGKQDAQLIVVCLVHSRALSDVNAALNEIEEKLFKQIILVLLHFKQSDKRKCSSEMKSNRRFSDMTIIDLFQQPESDNIDDVFKKIIDAINSFE